MKKLILIATISIVGFIVCCGVVRFIADEHISTLTRSGLRDITQTFGKPVFSSPAQASVVPQSAENPASNAKIEQHDLGD